MPPAAPAPTSRTSRTRRPAGPPAKGSPAYPSRAVGTRRPAGAPPPAGRPADVSRTPGTRRPADPPRTAVVRPPAGPPAPVGSLRPVAPRRPVGPPPTARSGPHHWFAERLLAVVSGRRPVHSLLGHTVGPAYQQLVTLAPADPAGGERLSPVIRRCGRFIPGPGVIEAFARIVTGDRVTAMAFRLEQGPDLRWRCAAVELQGMRP
ncbi:Rv3235 family protein [Streptomyces xanthophaeus]